VIINSIDYNMNIAAAVAAPRIHHQWQPEDVRAERGIPEQVLNELRDRGHKVVDTLGQTSANSIAVTPNGPLGAPDPRTRGAWAAGQ
jgi:gamma-glutamyltranspeptidase/glutathione hydrolase